MNKTIELNEQQVEMIKAFMQDVIEESGGLEWSNSSKSVASQILAKMEE